MKRFFLVGVLLGITLLLLVGCSGDQTNTANSTTQTQEKAQATPGIGSVATASSNRPKSVPTATATPVPIADSTIVNDFYHALQAKDYTTAYGYLSADATSDGQALTETSFTQIAQAADSMNGPVTGFDFLANASDPTSIVSSVTRKQSMQYSAHLQLQQQDGVWKIISLDTI